MVLQILYICSSKSWFIRYKNGFYSTLASFFSISGGASVGMYGPLVHFGGTIGAYLREDLLYQIFHDIIIGSGVECYFC